MALFNYCVEISELCLSPVFGMPVTFAGLIIFLNSQYLFCIVQWKYISSNRCICVYKNIIIKSVVTYKVRTSIERILLLSHAPDTRICGPRFLSTAQVYGILRHMKFKYLLVKQRSNMRARSFSLNKLGKLVALCGCSVFFIYFRYFLVFFFSVFCGFFYFCFSTWLFLLMFI